MTCPAPSRSACQELARVSPGDLSWYGADVGWQLALEAGARREHGRDLLSTVGVTRLVYRVPVEVPGRREATPVRIMFHAAPPYECYGLPPEHYPRVHADPGAASPHRMPDDALCLFFPASPPQGRWHPHDGLLALIDLIRNHMFYEDCWREDGGTASTPWFGAEAPHGFPDWQVRTGDRRRGRPGPRR